MRSEPCSISALTRLSFSRRVISNAMMPLNASTATRRRRSAVGRAPARGAPPTNGWICCTQSSALTTFFATARTSSVDFFARSLSIREPTALHAVLMTSEFCWYLLWIACTRSDASCRTFSAAF